MLMEPAPRASRVAGPAVIGKGPILHHDLPLLPARSCISRSSARPHGRRLGRPRNRRIDRGGITTLFGLSEAEGRLALAILRLGSLSFGARESQVTEGSVRQYLKRISSKPAAAARWSLSICSKVSLTGIRNA